MAARFSITYPSGRVALSGVSDGIRAQVREQGGRAGRRARVCVRVRMKCVVHTLCLVTGGRRARVHVAYGSSSSSWQLFNFTIVKHPPCETWHA